MIDFSKWTRFYKPATAVVVVGSIFGLYRYSIVETARVVEAEVLPPRAVNDKPQPALPVPQVLALPSDQSGARLRFTKGEDVLRTFRSERKFLQDYVEVQAKVLLTEDDQERKTRILSDGRSLRSLLPWLLTAAKPGSEFDKLQAAALDVLLEARNQNGSEDAGSVLRSTLTDNSVEDAQLSVAERESLAGIKAEILMKWTSQEPSLVGQVGSWLPGPASQAIWANVQTMQSSNEAESNAELAELAKNP